MDATRGVRNNLLDNYVPNVRLWVTSRNATGRRRRSKLGVGARVEAGAGETAKTRVAGRWAEPGPPVGS